jgi:hypothetical protein
MRFRQQLAHFPLPSLGARVQLKACSQFFDSHVILELLRLCDGAEPQRAVQKPTTPASNDRRIASLRSTLQPTGKEAGGNYA